MKKLLVADDSVTIQKVIKLALSSDGYDILAVSDGKEAIRAIQEEKPDVVLIDVALPHADACEVKNTINKDSSLNSIKFILLASAFEKVDEVAIEKARFSGRLIKPFDPSALRKMISGALSGALNANEHGGYSSAPGSTNEQEPIASFTAPTREDPSFEPRYSGAHSSFTADPEPGLVPPIPGMVISMPPPPPPVDFDAHLNLEPLKDEMPTIRDHSNISVSTAEFEMPTDSETPAPPANMPPPPRHHDEDELTENDIKNLTESTIRMSGLEEAEWNLDDTRRMKSPVSHGGTDSGVVLELSPTLTPTEPVEETKRIVRNPQKIDKIVASPLPHAKILDDGGSSFMKNFKSPTPAPASVSTLHSESHTPLSKGPVQPVLSRAEMETLIRKDLSDIVEKLAREMLPQVAEAVIKKEIEKILAEP